MTGKGNDEGLALRAACADALVRVLRARVPATVALDRFVYGGGGFAEARDRGLAKELVTGVLRWKGSLERVVAAMATRGKLPYRGEWGRMVLLGAMYQLLCMERVPSWAAVNSAVELVKRREGAGAASFTNAVLRRCARGGSLKWLAAETGAGTWEEVVWASYPAWLRRRLEETFGPVEAQAAAAAMNERPAIFLRLDGVDAPAAAAALAGELPGCAAAPGRWLAATCLRVEGGGDLTRLRLYREGRATPQDEGSQLAARCLGVRAGDRVLDACCGTGVKTAFVGRAAAGGLVAAVDVSARKLLLAGAEARRVGAPGVRPLVADTRSLPLGRGAAFDRVLVDAPCTGTGTLARRPEIKARIAEEDPARLAQLQGEILAGAARHLRPGGLLLYGVCSLLPEEGEQVVGRFLEGNPGWRPAAPEGLPGGIAGEAGRVRLLPHRHGTEGFFLAALTRD